MKSVKSGKFCIVRPTFWSDDLIEKFDNDEKFFFLYLLTNPECKQAGIFRLPVRTIIFHLETWTEEKVKATLDKFEKLNRIIYNHDTQEIAILNYLKHSVIAGGKPIADCVDRDLSLVKDTALIQKVYDHMKAYMDKEIVIAQEREKLSPPSNDLTEPVKPKETRYNGILRVFELHLPSQKVNAEIQSNDNDNKRYGGRVADKTAGESCDESHNVSSNDTAIESDSF